MFRHDFNAAAGGPAAALAQDFFQRAPPWTWPAICWDAPWSALMASAWPARSARWRAYVGEDDLASHAARPDASAIAPCTAPAAWPTSI